MTAISTDLDAYFRPGVLSAKLRGEILAFLCFSPDLIQLPKGFLDGMTEMNLGGCVLPDGLFAQVKLLNGQTLSIAILNSSLFLYLAIFNINSFVSRPLVGPLKSFCLHVHVYPRKFSICFAGHIR